MSELSRKVKCVTCDGKGFTLLTPLALLRKKAGLKQSYVAKQLGYTRTSLSNLEQGKQLPPITRIKKIAEVYETDESTVYRAIIETSQPND